VGAGKVGRAVRLRLPTGFGLLVMAGWLIEFKRCHPDIALDVLFDNRVDDLWCDQVDVVVCVMPESPEQRGASELARVRGWGWMRASAPSAS